MIFTKISSAQSKQWLKETGSNWLLRETERRNELALDYINKDGTLASVKLYLTADGWQTADEVDTDHDSQNSTPDIPILLPRYEKLQMCIIKVIRHLHDTNEIDWLLPSHIRLIPEKDEAAKLEHYVSDVSNESNNNEKQEPAAPFFFNSENWVHRFALRNCLLDKRLYPYETFKEIIFTAHNTKVISLIQNELAKLLNNEQPKLDDSLRSHSYYKKVQEVFNYRVNRILEEFSPAQIEINKKLVAAYNESEKKSTSNNANNKSSKESIPVENNVISLSDGSCAYIATCQGDRPYQEDRAFVIDGIKLDPSWNNRIPELLVYTVQEMAAKIYEKYPAESSEQAIGTTLSLVFIWDNIAYIAWLGDSPFIRISDTEKGIAADYLSWLHRCDQNPAENREILVKQEENRIETESGMIVVTDESIRLNGILIVTRGFGNRCPKLGDGFSDIPSIVVKNLNNEKDTFILSSDGIETLSLNQLTDIVQTTPINRVAEVACDAAYISAPKKADNITVAAFKGQNGILSGLFDGHGRKKGYLFAEFCREHLPITFKKHAETKAPYPVTNIKTKSSSTSTTDSFFKEKRKSPFSAASQQTTEKEEDMVEESVNLVKKIKVETAPTNKM